MKNPVIILLSVLFFMSCSNQDPTSIYSLKKVSSGPVIVDVNGTQVHQGFLDLLSSLNPRLKTQLSNPMTRKKILNSLVDQNLLYQEALKRNINKQEDVIVKSLLNKHVIISNALVEAELDNAMKKSYEEKKATQFTKIKVSLIASFFKHNVKKEDRNKKPTDKEIQDALSKIKTIQEKLNKGEDFAKLAKEESDDKKTKKKSGNAGQISKDDRRFARLGLKSVTEVAFKLKKNEVSKPIQTKKGYYLVKVTSDPIVVPFAEAERALRFELQNKVKQGLVSKLRKKAKIVFAQASAKMTKKDKKTMVDKAHGK